MGTEIERKYIISPDWEPETKGDEIAQGYLADDPMRTVRVRIRAGKGYLTVKGATCGIGRAEFEYEVPLKDAREMLAMCDTRVEKVRYLVPYQGHTWEADIFHGANEGLRMAEVELSSEDEEAALPPWVTRDVTGDARYYNAQLAKNPFSAWKNHD